jgi:hypothetical protein
MEGAEVIPEDLMERLVKALESRNDGDTLLDMDGVALLLGISRNAVRERYKRRLLPKRIPASTPYKPMWRKRDLIGGEG